MPLSGSAITAMLTWLELADLPEPPLYSIPGVESYDVELIRDHLLAPRHGARPPRSSSFATSPLATVRPRSASWPSPRTAAYIPNLRRCRRNRASLHRSADARYPQAL